MWTAVACLTARCSIYGQRQCCRLTFPGACGDFSARLRHRWRWRALAWKPNAFFDRALPLGGCYWLQVMRGSALGSGGTMSSSGTG
mmetsp:Transcript_28100/g.59495  ORF Transcript_28100/g.59495 Transcript_28100/m.59495 type:complete len:86 (+) Transcript_28100:441-698(+)